MYQATIDGVHLCSTNSVGGFDCISDPVAKLIVNGADSFDFVLYPQHPVYPDVVCKVSRVKIWQDSKLIFYGTVTSYSETMDGVRTYSCEGALAWLNELCVPSYHISSATPEQVLSWYISSYNKTVRDKSKKFKLGIVTVKKAKRKDGTEGTIARSSGVHPSYWEEISQKLLDSFGGILRIRYTGEDDCAGVIDWLAIPDATCDQDIRYAKNLMNCDWTYDATPIVTAVVPLGKKKDGSSEEDDEFRVDILKSNDTSMTALLAQLVGDDYVKSGDMVYSKSRVEKYGLIQKTVTFDDESATDTIAYLGAVWLKQNGMASSTVSAEAIDIADIDESVSHFVCGDYVRTQLPGYEEEQLFPVTSIEIPLAAPEDARLTVGTQESGIASGGTTTGGGSISDVGSGSDAMAHTHANKGVLDQITEQDYADFKSAVSKAHTHDNKDTLDKLTPSVWSELMATKNKAHTHNNKDTLDKIDETSWTRVYGMSHEHDNKDVLDQITQEEWTAINSAKNKAHTHDNKATLDKIDDVSWLTVYGQTHEHSNKDVLDKITASYTTEEKTKLKGIADGAEVNQNAFSSIATGSSKYTASTKQASFLVEGNGGTTVSLDTKTGRLTIASHQHSNQNILDQLNEEQWKIINGAANKAHVHDNKDTLDKITDALWNTVYSNTHTHDNKSVLDGTTASYTVAEQTKLSDIESGAKKNVQSDWNATSGDAFIKNKPTIPDISGKQDKSTAVTHTANTAVGSATKPVYIAANGAATPISHSINADVPANAKFTDTTYSIKWVTIDANFATKFRTEAKGDTAAGGFLSGVRCDTANVAGAPQYGSGIAWGTADTHGYLYTMYDKAEAYLGGGNADRLQWIKQISFEGHTHRDLDQIGNAAYYGSDAANSDGWYKIYSGRLTGYNDHVARISIVKCLTYGHGVAFIHLRCNNDSSISVQNLSWETRYAFNPGHIAIKTNGNDYGIYVYQSTPQYGRIKVRVLESSGTASNWTMTLSDNFTKESSFTPSATAVDSSVVNAANVLTTSRTLTIGNTGKAFNGSANVSWSLDEIGVIGRTTSGKTYTFNSQSLTGDASSFLFNDYSNNQAGGGTYQSVFGNQCKAFNGNTIFVTGWKNTVQGNQASGFGENNNVNGEASSSFGDSNSVTGIADVGFGQSNVLTGDFNAVFGRANTIGGTDNVTFGYGNKINGNKNFATGEGNTIGANCTGGATIGNYNTCNNNAGLSGGWYSYVDANQGIAYGNHCRTSYQSSASFGAYNSYSKIGVQLTLGNGTESARANAFRAAADGVYSSGAYHTSGADYAEYFEWLDGNLDGEDRRGRFVKLDGEKILLAESIDDDILGIVSGNPSVVGDSYEDQWQGQYLTDIYGELLTEDYTDEDGTTRKVWVLNPDYDPEKVYVPRSERREWSAVGMMGKLIVIDDGTCKPNDYCVPTTGGIATRSEGRVGYRVLSRVDETHIKVLIKG